MSFHISKLWLILKHFARSYAHFWANYLDYLFCSFSIEDTQALKSKKAELRLYCDLLMQEIHKVKNIRNRENDTSNGDEPDETMVKATCDTFIQTLDELMDLADQQYHIYGNHRVSIEFK